MIAFVQVHGVAVDGVYHLELDRSVASSPTSISSSLHISLLSVALVKVETGADFASLVTANNATT